MTTTFRSEIRSSPYGLAGLHRIVARINYIDDQIFDWAAYVGVGDTQDVADNGDKLLAGSATVHFPDLPVEKYRA